LSVCFSFRLIRIAPFSPFLALSFHPKIPNPMKTISLPLLLLFSVLTISLAAQGNIYTKRISQPNINLRGAVVNLGELNLTFPADGYVVVHFDGECYASVGDRIVLAASNIVDWDVNDGTIAVENSMPGFGRPFSHTRV
jgi:hypothetical protein